MEKPILIDPEQAWFWTEEWQAKEREADENILNGEYSTFYSIEELIASLKELEV